MFIVIEPTEQNYHKKHIRPFLKHIKNNPTLKCSFRDNEKATFIISENKSKDIYGGAILLKQTSAGLHKSIQRNRLNNKSVHEDIWICTLFVRKENNRLSQHFDFFFETFYRDLYNMLVEFGKKENTSFLYLILESGEYLCTQALGCWPHTFEVSPEEFRNSLFHSILSLTINSSKPNTNPQESMVYKEIKLAA